MFKIGEFSTLSKTTIKTLRYYDEIGLLKPAYIDEATGYRYYETAQLFKLHQIQALRQSDVSIEDIRQIMSGENIEMILEKHRLRLQKEIDDKAEQLSRLEFILTGKEEESFMNYTVILKELPECIVYTKQLNVPSYDAYFELIPAIGAQMQQQYPDLKCRVPEYCFIISLDGEYKESNFRVEFCEAVETMKPDFDDIHFKKMASVLAASIMHKGDYAGLSKAYATLIQWIEENDYEPIQMPRENYIDGIWNKDSSEDWLTEIQIPIRKKK